MNNSNNETNVRMTELDAGGFLKWQTDLVKNSTKEMTYTLDGDKGYYLTFIKNNIKMTILTPSGQVRYFESIANALDMLFLSYYKCGIGIKLLPATMDEDSAVSVKRVYPIKLDKLLADELISPIGWLFEDNKFTKTIGAVTVSIFKNPEDSSTGVLNIEGVEKISGEIEFQCGRWESKATTLIDLLHYGVRELRELISGTYGLGFELKSDGLQPLRSCSFQNQIKGLVFETFYKDRDQEHIITIITDLKTVISSGIRSIMPNNPINNLDTWYTMPIPFNVYDRNDLGHFVNPILQMLNATNMRLISYLNKGPSAPVVPDTPPLGMPQPLYPLTPPYPFPWPNPNTYSIPASSFPWTSPVVPETDTPSDQLNQFTSPYLSDSAFKVTSSRDTETDRIMEVYREHYTGTEMTKAVRYVLSIVKTYNLYNTLSEELKPKRYIEAVTMLKDDDFRNLVGLFNTTGKLYIE